MLLLVSICFAATVQAQLVSGNLFLKGRYVEVGAQPNASFGSKVDAPAGYHPHNNGIVSYCAGFLLTDVLGFVSDHNMDGWDIGTPPYDGDYFTPGSPWEGWAISVDGGPTYQQNSTDCPSDSLGSFITYNEEGSTKYGIWRGMVDSIQITKRIVLDTNALYFYTIVTFTNLSTVAHNDIYYVRAFDPDNAQTWTGDFKTYNRINYQRPNIYNASVVSATASVADSTVVSLDSCVVAMGTADTNAKCFIPASWHEHLAVPLADVYNETHPGLFYYSTDFSVDLDFAIGIIFHIDHLAPVDSAADSVGRTTAHPANSQTIRYFHCFGKQAIDSALHNLYNINIADTITTSITTINREEIVAYPNPTKDAVTINGLHKGDKITCLDITGCAEGEELIVDTDQPQRYSLQGLPQGHYLLLVADDQGHIISRQKIEKQ